MLNAEYWRDRIGILNGDRIAVVNDFPVYCSLCNCEDCDLRHSLAYDNSCSYNFIQWLIKEHIESDTDWTRVPSETPVRVWDDDGDDAEVYDRPFMCYLPNEKRKFWAFSDPVGREMADGWAQCQLVRPEDIEKYRRKTDDKS